MELADLVHALTSGVRRRPWLSFGLGGLLLLAVRAGMGDTGPRELVVVDVSRGASPSEVARATDEALLLAFAERSGFVLRDPVVLDRLIRNVRFAEPGLDDAAALDRALALDMHRTDPVARGRLLWLATEALTRPGPPPTDAVLEDYATRHARRFIAPDALSFAQIFVSRQRHGEDFDARVATVAADPDPRASDPTLLPASVTAESEVRVDARFGPGFAAQVRDLEPGVWSGPVFSAFGAHFVRLSEAHHSENLPAFGQIRDKVLVEHDRDTRPERLREALDQLRTRYEVQLRERT